MRGRRFGTLLLFLCIAAVAAAAVYMLFYRGRETAAVDLPGLSSSEQSGSNGGEPGLGKYTLADITPDTVQDAVRTLSRIESYSRTVTIQTFWSGGSGSEQLECYVSGGDCLVVSGQQRLLVSGGTVYVWYDGGSRVLSSAVSGERPQLLDRYMRQLTYEELLELDPSAISAAGYEEYAGEGCIWAEYDGGGSFGYTSRVYVSTATGLLMGAERYDNGELIYRMTSDALVSDPPDSSLFEPPL